MAHSESRVFSRRNRFGGSDARARGKTLLDVQLPPARFLTVIIRFMATGPFTIRIFVPDGDPEGVRLIDRMNWTGHGIVFPRSKWPEVRQRAEFIRAGVYILVGYQDEDLDT